MSESPSTAETVEYADPQPSSSMDPAPREEGASTLTEPQARIPLSRGGKLGDSVADDPMLHQLPEIPQELLDPHGSLHQPNTLPGYNGVPFRGAEIPHVKESDPVKPEIALDGQAAVFDLSNPDHLKYYRDIFHLAYNGMAQVGIDRVDFDQQTGKYKAFVRWALVYSHMPKGGRRTT